jgi:Ca-activated chloride channel homolog
MSFVSPLFLLTLVVVPLVAFLALSLRRRRSRFPVAYTNLDILASVTRPGWVWRAWIPLGLLLLALTFAAVALARPRVDVTKAQQHAVVVLLVDVSGSMQATDVAPSRIAAATNAMTTFVQRLPKTAQVGLVEFSTEPAVLQTPTTDHGTLLEEIGLLTPQGATALGDGIGTAVAVVRQSLGPAAQERTNGYVPGAVVLLSDGAQNRGSLRPLQAAQLAKAAGIRVFTIAFGTSKGTVRFEGVPGPPIPVPPDPATMRAIASVTGGQTFTAQSADEATHIYQNLGSTLARTHVRRDLTTWLSLGAGLLLIAAVGAGIAFGPLLP